MDAYTSLYTAGVPALVSTAITIVYFLIKLVTYFLHAGTREAESREGTLHNSISGHDQGSASGAEGPGQVYLNIPRYPYNTEDNGRGQWPQTTRPVFLHTERQDLRISPTRDDTGDKTMPPLRTNVEGYKGRRSSYPRDDIRPGSQGPHLNTAGIHPKGRRGDDAANQEPQHYERTGGEGRQRRPDPIHHDGIQGPATTGEAGHTSAALQEVSTIGVQTESCDTIYVSKDTLIAYTIAVVQNTQTIHFERMQVALQTVQNQASIETLLKAEQLMMAHFNLAILTDDIASNTYVDAPAGQTGIPASKPPTSADAEETICKTLNTNLPPRRRD